MPEYRWAARNFLRHEGGERWWKYSTLINISSKAQEKRDPQGNILEFFLLDTLKTTFWIENLTQRWTQLGPFFPKLGHFFQFSKRAVEVFLLPLIAHLECGWICMNIPKYPWKILKKTVQIMLGLWTWIIILHIQLAFEDALGSK